MDQVYIGQPMPAPTKMPPQHRGISGRLLLVIVGLLVAVLAGIGLIVAGQDRSAPLSQRLSLRLDALTDILKDGKKNASSDKLKKVTAEASLLLAGDVAAIKAVAPETKGKPSATVTEAEDGKPSIERLKQAKINATYDSAYTSELTAKLETTSALVKELYGETRNKKFKEALNTTYKHLVQLQRDLAAN